MSPARATWLGHASVTLDLPAPDGVVRLVTDPVLRRRVGPLVRDPALPLEDAWAGADAVLLSHLHHDHADLPSLRRFDRAPVAVHEANAAWLARRGSNAAGLDDWSWWSPAPGVEVARVPTIHHARPMPHRPNAVFGFLIRTAELAVWVAGDTELFPELGDLAAMAGRPIDLALVPIAGWGPRLSPGHLGPDEAAEAIARVGARHTIAIHHATLRPAGWPAGRRAWMTAPLARFAEVLPRRSDSVLHPLACGESVFLPDPAR